MSGCLMFNSIGCIGVAHVQYNNNTAAGIIPMNVVMDFIKDAADKGYLAKAEDCPGIQIIKAPKLWPTWPKFFL